MMTTLAWTDNTMHPASKIPAPNTGLQSGSDSQYACPTPPITVYEQPKALPPKCASVPGLIPSSTHSPRVIYRTSNHPQLIRSQAQGNIKTSSSTATSNTNTTTTTHKSKPFSKSQSMTGSMTARKPLRSSPLAGPPALFDTASDSDSGENEDTLGPMVTMTGDAPVAPSSPLSFSPLKPPPSPRSLSWGVSPIDPHSPPPSHLAFNTPPFLSDGLSPEHVSTAGSPSSRLARVLHPPRPPPECHLHPRAATDNDSASFTDAHKSWNWYQTVKPSYKCTCRSNPKLSSSDTKDGLSAKKNGHSMLKKKRSPGLALTSTPSFQVMPSSLHTAQGRLIEAAENPLPPIPSIHPIPTNPNLQNLKKKTTEAGTAAPPPSSRSVPSRSGKKDGMEHLKKGREFEEADNGRGWNVSEQWDGDLRDCVDDDDVIGAGSGVDLDVDGGGSGGVNEGAGGLARSVTPGELVLRGTEVSERARGSEGRVSTASLGVGGRPVSIHAVVGGESRPRKDEWETNVDSRVRLVEHGIRRHNEKRRMTMLEFSRNANKDTEMVHEWDEFGVSKPPSQHLLSPLSAQSAVGNKVGADRMTRRTSMGNMLNALSDDKTTRWNPLSASTTSIPLKMSGTAITPSTKRLSTSTSSPLSLQSQARSASPAPTPHSPASPTPKPKRPSPTDNSWYIANPYGETPKFTRLGLSAPNVVMPISAKDHLRSRRGQPSTTVNGGTQRRWSNFPSGSLQTLPHVPDSPSSADEGGTKSYTSCTSETEAEGETLSRSSSASATTSSTSSNGSAYWSACTTTTMASPTSTLEGASSESMERVASVDLGECMGLQSFGDRDFQHGRITGSSITCGTVKQTNYAHKSPRKNLGIMMGLPSAFATLRAGSVHSSQPIPHDEKFTLSEVTLTTGDRGVEVYSHATASSQSLVHIHPEKIPTGAHHTSSTPALGRYSSSCSHSFYGQHGVGGVEGTGEGRKLKRGDSSVKRWWKSLLGAARESRGEVCKHQG